MNNVLNLVLPLVILSYYCCCCRLSRLDEEALVVVGIVREEAVGPGLLLVRLVMMTVVASMYLTAASMVMVDLLVPRGSLIWENDIEKGLVILVLLLLLRLKSIDPLLQLPLVLGLHLVHVALGLILKLGVELLLLGQLFLEVLRIDLVERAILGVLLGEQLLHVVPVDGSVRLQRGHNLLVGDPVPLQLLIAPFAVLLPLLGQLLLVDPVVDGLAIVGHDLGAAALWTVHLGRLLVAVVADDVAAATKVEEVLPRQGDEAERADDGARDFSEALELGLGVGLDVGDGGGGNGTVVVVVVGMLATSDASPSYWNFPIRRR